MRLIDADLAVAKCNEDIEAVKDIPQRVDGILDAIMNIHECPTIEERKNGKWIVDDVETEHCSVCKHRFYISALFAVGGNDEPPSCPNCGARMENYGTDK